MKSHFHLNARADVRHAGMVSALAALALFAGSSFTRATADEPAAANGPPATSVGGNQNEGLGEIVVTARRRAENLQEEPLSIQALTSVQLEQAHVQELSDITNIANVNFTEQPGFMNTIVPFIRGIGEMDPIVSNDPPIAMYVDGVLLARQIGMNFDLVDPQSVEVLRGPQGSLFGRNTTGGAVSITLPLPTDDFSLQAKGGYASNDEQTYRLTLNSGLIDDSGLKAMLAVQYHMMDGYVRNALTDDAMHWPGSDETTATYFDLHGNIGARGSFDFRADYSHSLNMWVAGQASYASPADIAYFGKSPDYGGDPFIVSPTRLGTIDVYPTGPLSTGQFGGTSLTFNLPVNDAFNLKSISAWRSFSTTVYANNIGQGLLLGPVVNPATFAYAGIAPVSPLVNEPGVLGRNEGDHTYQYQISQEFQVTGEVARNKYTGGVFAFQEQAGESYLLFLDVPLPPTGAVALPDYSGLNFSDRAQSYAVYGSDSFTPPILDDKLELTGGVRYTIDRKWIDFMSLPQLTLPTATHYASFRDPSGDFTAKYQWTQDVMTYFRFANAYKSGGFTGRDSPSDPGFKPEFANNWELGGKSDFLDKRMRLNADIFYTTYKDKQITTFLPGAANVLDSHVVNAGKAVYYGDEVELSMLPAKGWEVDVNYGHTVPKYKQFLYQPSANAPEENIASSAKFPYFSTTSYSIGTTYTFTPTPVGQPSMHVDFDYKSGQYFFPSDILSPLNEMLKSGSQNILNASIDLAHIPTSSRIDLDVSVYGKNLLNKSFPIEATDYEIVPGYDNFASSWFVRPRVVGVYVTGKY